MEKLKECKWEVDDDTSGKITCRDERTVDYQSVQLGQNIENVEDPLQPAFIVEMAPV